MSRWTPVDIKTLLSFYTTPAQGREELPNAALENLIGAGLLVLDFPKNELVLSDHGLAFISFLLDMPVPERQWHLPTVPHKL